MEGRQEGQRPPPGAEPFPYHTYLFPYERALDALVTRRDYLRLLVLTSFGLLVGNAALALRGLLAAPATFPRQRVARLADVPEGEALGFEYPEREDQAILLHLPGGRFVAYSRVCTHLSCAVFWDRTANRIECPCHEGFFDPQTGLVIAGPPPRPLPRIALEVASGEIFAVGVEK